MTIHLPNIPILMYHEVWANLSPESKIHHTNPAYIVSRQTFEEQMQYLHDDQFRTQTLDEYLNASLQHDLKRIIITFDDGWSNNYWEAFPILKRLGLKATIFVATSFIGQKDYMDWEKLRKMQEAGISIQSHTASHGALTEKSDGDIRNELEMSKSVIENRLGAPVEYLSAPHGMVNQKVIDVARKLGYRAICTSEPGFRHFNGRPAILGRINVPSNIRPQIFQGICKQSIRTILPILVSKRLKGMVKSLLGYSFYRKLYQLRYRIEK